MTIANTLTRGAEAVRNVMNEMASAMASGLNHSNGNCPAMSVTVKCSDCGELVTTRVDRVNDLMSVFGATEGDDSPNADSPVGYMLHKDIVGKECQNLMRLTMRFDDARKVIDYDVSNGTVVEYSDHD